MSLFNLNGASEYEEDSYIPWSTESDVQDDGLGNMMLIAWSPNTYYPSLVIIRENWGIVGLSVIHSFLRIKKFGLYYQPLAKGKRLQRIGISRLHLIKFITVSKDTENT